LLALVLTDTRGSRLIAWSALAVGTYSAVIEVGQRIAGSHEHLRSSIADVGFGVLGGAIGALAAVWLASRLKSSPRYPSRGSSTPSPRASEPPLS